MDAPADVLRKLGMTGILTMPPEKGGVTQVLCDVDECFCPRGRGYFDPISRDDEELSTGCPQRSIGRLAAPSVGPESWGTSACPPSVQPYRRTRARTEIGACQEGALGRSSSARVPLRVRESRGGRGPVDTTLQPEASASGCLRPIPQG